MNVDSCCKVAAGYAVLYSFIMLKYFRISLFVALALSVTYIVLMRQTFSAAHDGSGPDGDALIAFFVSILAIIALVHAGIIALILFDKNAQDAKKGFVILALGALLVAFPYLKNQANHMISDHQYSSSPYGKMYDSIRNKESVEAFIKNFSAVTEKDLKFYDDLIFQLCVAGRIDILDKLQSTKSIASVEKNESTWGSCVYGAVSSKNLNSKERLDLVNWVFNRPFNSSLSLQGQSADIFGVDHFFESFKDVKNLQTQQLFKLLIQHGADLNAGDSIPVLWYAARFKYFEHVQFLIQQKADLNKLDSGGTTALDQALENKDQAIIDLLTKAGAKKSIELKK